MARSQRVPSTVRCTRHQADNGTSRRGWCRYARVAPGHGNHVSTPDRLSIAPGPIQRKNGKNPLSVSVCLLTQGGLIRGIGLRGILYPTIRTDTRHRERVSRRLSRGDQLAHQLPPVLARSRPRASSRSKAFFNRTFSMVSWPSRRSHSAIRASSLCTRPWPIKACSAS
jgi:hypothetical protein